MIRFLAFCAAVATFAACNDWTEMETVDSKVEKPWEQDPALWAEYTAALRAYKQSEHFVCTTRPRKHRVSRISCAASRIRWTS